MIFAGSMAHCGSRQRWQPGSGIVFGKSRTSFMDEFIFIAIGVVSFGLAGYLFAAARRRIGYYVIAILLLVISAFVAGAFICGPGVRNQSISTLRPQYPAAVLSNARGSISTVFSKVGSVLSV